MRICLLSRFFDLKNNSGIGRIGIEVRDRLIKRGHDVITMQVGSPSHLAYLKYTAWDLRHLPAADIYHAITPMEAIYLPKQRSVATILDLIPILYPDKAGARMNFNPVNRWLGSEYFKFGVRQAVKCKRIITIADETKADLMRLYGLQLNKISVLKPGIREDLEPKPKPDNVFRIGYLGQLDHRKRVGLLVEAFKQSNIQGELVIAGCGPDRAKLEAMANGDSRIKFLGFIPDSQICDFYNSLDLFCFPTMVEGLGLPILEAMACKKPVQVWGDSIIPNVLSQRVWRTNGKYFMDGNDNLSSLHMKYRKIMVNGAYDFAKSFTWSGFIDGLEKVYSEVLGE